MTGGRSSGPALGPWPAAAALAVVAAAVGIAVFGPETEEEATGPAGAAPRRPAPPLGLAAADTAPGDRSWTRSPGRDADAAPLDFSPADSAVSAADFVGARACRECHREQYRAWSASTHGNAGGSPAPDTVIAPFDSDTLRFRDATVVAGRTEGGGYEFRIRWEGHGEYRYSVDAVVGKGHMAGGGNQGFFTRAEDGTYRFLPFDFSRTEGRWFCNTAARGDRGWRPVEQLELAECSDWPPSRALGNIPRLNNCQECHGSQIRVEVRRGTPHYDTRFTSLTVNCESCHGPGREHVRLARSGRIPGREDIGIRGLAALGKDASVRVCLQCHGLKTPLRDGFLPGKSLRRHYALKYPMLGERPYFADGRIRTFGYQATHLSSECYLAGSMTCVDCHAPHSQEYRDHTGRSLEGRFSNGQCTSCHPSKAGPGLTRHTHHPRGSEGSRCVACHMPYLQELQLGREIRYARSDHTIPVPRPAFDSSLGLDSLRLENACEKCHDGRSPRTLQRQATAWWGELKPQDPLVRGLLRVDSVRDLGRAAELVLQPGRRNPMAQFEGLNRVLLQHLRPDMDSLPADVRTRIERLSRSEDLAVQALALASLHYARGRDPEVRSYLDRKIRSLSDERGPALDRWAVALGFLGDTHRKRGELNMAVTAYRRALEVRPDRPGLHLALGRAYAARGNPSEAISEYRRVLEIDSTRTLAYVNLGIARAAQGMEQKAIRAYRQALEVNPDEPLAHFNLGNLHLRARRPGKAAESYRQALDLDPGLVPARVNLARSLILQRRYRAALESARLALEFDPDNETATKMVRDLEKALSRGRRRGP